MTDPTVGVWISDDGSVGTPDPSNSYRYVGNDPVNEIDPSGLAAASRSDKAVGAALLGAYNNWMRLFRGGAALGAQLPKSQSYAALEAVLQEWEADFATQFTPWYYTSQMLTSNRTIVRNITKQITLLGDSDFFVREGASKCLRDTGSITYPFVLVATRDLNREIRLRSSQLLENMPRTSNSIYNQALLLYLTQRLQQVLSQMNPADRRKVLSIMGNVPSP